MVVVTMIMNVSNLVDLSKWKDLNEHATTHKGNFDMVVTTYCTSQVPLDMH